MKRLLLILALTTLCASLFSVSSAKPRADLVIDGLSKPVFLTAPTNTKDYLYVLEKDGRIRLYNRETKKLEEKPFLDITDRIKITMNEQGLLGMAFSPDFKKDRRYYLYYTDRNGDTCVSRFTAKSATESNRDEEILLTQKQDFKNHNGGWIGFGPDDLLYIAFGDGGAANDPKKRAQDLTTLLGKLVRIDVDVSSGYEIPKDNPFIDDEQARPEILSYGLRNPWRCAWHKDTLIIGDVGQNVWEEVNAVSIRDLNSANFGWPQIEGTHKTKNAKAETKNPGKLIKPIYEYKHDNSAKGGLSITGGYIYRGSVRSLQGKYIFADYVKPHIWSAKASKTKLTSIKHHKDDFKQNDKPIEHISSFGEDPQGELYILSHQGQVYMITE